MEKLTKAVLLAKGIEAGIEHRLEELFKRLMADDPWIDRLHPLASYSAYATAFDIRRRAAASPVIRPPMRFVET